MILLRRNEPFLEAMLGGQEIPKKSVYSVEIGTTCWKEWEFRISLKFDRCSVKWLVLRLIWYSCLAVSQGNITPPLFVLSHLKKSCLGIKVVWYKQKTTLDQMWDKSHMIRKKWLEVTQTSSPVNRFTHKTPFLETYWDVTSKAPSVLKASLVQIQDLYISTSTPFPTEM